MSENDRDWLREFRVELDGLSPEEAVLRVLSLNAQLDEAKKRLFENTPALVEVPAIGTSDPRLMGYLESVMGNESDARIVAEAVEWGREGGSRVIVTGDREDMLGDEETEGTEDERSQNDQRGSEALELPDFEGLIGSEKPQPEQINEQISQRYDDEATLLFLSPEAYLARRN